MSAKTQREKEKKSKYSHSSHLNQAFPNRVQSLMCRSHGFGCKHDKFQVYPLLLISRYNLICFFLLLKIKKEEKNTQKSNKIHLHLAFFFCKKETQILKNDDVKLNEINLCKNVWMRTKNCFKIKYDDLPN